MAIIDVEAIERQLKELKEEIIVREERFDDFQEPYQEPEPEKDEYELSEEIRIQEIEEEQEILFHLNIQKRRLERLKNVKEIGDVYSNLYSEGYENVIKGEKNYEIEDLLARKKEAKKITEKIKEGKIKTVGVFGDWGTGKSTFLGFIEEELAKNSVQTIRVDASEYSDQDKIWAYIYSQIREKFSSDFGRKINFFIKKLKKDLFYIILNIVLSIAVIGALIYPVSRGLVEYFIKNSGDKNLSMWADKVMIIAYIYLYFKYILPKILVINSGVRNVGELFRNKCVIPNQDAVLGYKAEIKKDLDEMLKIWKKKIVLLVDEIDRCDEQVVVHFFDTLQLFQHSEMIQIVYAVDRRVVDRALENNGIPKGDLDNYLKKYIDYRINLYPINKDVDVLENIIKQYRFTKNEIIYIHTFFRKYLQVNITIRDLKDILNVLCEMKREWLTENIFTKKYENDSNYVISFMKFIPWAIYAMTDSKWVSYILEDIPTKAEIIQNNDIEIEFNHIISRNKLGEKYANCPKYIRESRIMDMHYYKELIEKYKTL